MNKNRTYLHNAFLQLVRLGIGTGTVPSFKFQGVIDWRAVKDLAEKQGLGAVVLDGVEKLPEQQRPPKVFLLEWIGETLQGYEYRFEQYCKAIAEMAGFYNSHGYKMMLLKRLKRLRLRRNSRKRKRLRHRRHRRRLRNPRRKKSRKRRMNCG